MSIKPGRVPSRLFDLIPSICRATEYPKLLVSVRSRMEADRAIFAGADILDVKEPSLGSLGMASIHAITEIARAEDVISGKIPLSVALGEISDWTNAAALPQLPHGIIFAKLGLSGYATVENWRAEWLRVREGFQNRSSSKLSWVAVAYADASAARSPSVSDVLAAAIETQCAGLLIDTFMKDGRRLTDEVDGTSLIKLADTCHHAGLFLALAGRLNRELLPLLANTNADVIGIRSAACQGIDRTSQLDPALISDFQNEIRCCFRAKGSKAN